MKARYIGIVIVVVVVLLGVAWYLFRPELLFIDKSVNEAAPEGGADLLYRGEFSGHAHTTTGIAEVLELEDGNRILRLSGFATSNGPDVRVLLVAAGAAENSDAVREAGYIELGSLKGNVGDQNYEVPRSVDFANHRAVVIWCHRFGVNFGSASLAAP